MLFLSSFGVLGVAFSDLFQTFSSSCLGVHRASSDASNLACVQLVISDFGVSVGVAINDMCLNALSRLLDVL